MKIKLLDIDSMSIEEMAGRFVHARTHLEEQYNALRVPTDSYTVGVIEGLRIALKLLDARDER